MFPCIVFKRESKLERGWIKISKFFVKKTLLPCCLFEGLALLLNRFFSLFNEEKSGIFGRIKVSEWPRIMACFADPRIMGVRSRTRSCSGKRPSTVMLSS